MQLGRPLSTLDPAVPGAATLVRLVYEPLVRMNARGEPQALLAVNWQHDAPMKRWRFTLRPRVSWHDGTLLTGSGAAAALEAILKQRYPDAAVAGAAQSLTIQSEKPMPDLLDELSLPRAALVKRAAEGQSAGTGPFQPTEWAGGKGGTLKAFDDYWAGRPYLDSVAIDMGRTAQPQEGVDHVAEIPIAPGRRNVPPSFRIWMSEPAVLLGLIAEQAPADVREALSIAIDRAAIVNALTQRSGEPAYSLLPSWLSGYAFLFQPAAGGLDRARELARSAKGMTFTIGAPPNDPLARAVAERIAVNARDAGLTLQVTGASATLRVVRLPVASTDAALSLRKMCEAAGISACPTSTAMDIEALYAAERTMVEARSVIPLVHLPEVLAIAPRVRNWDAAHRDGSMYPRLDRIWLAE